MKLFSSCVFKEDFKDKQKDFLDKARTTKFCVKFRAVQLGSLYMIILIDAVRCWTFTLTHDAYCLYNDFVNSISKNF